MCLAIPGQVISVYGLKAQVKYPGQVRAVLVGVDEIKPGDFVMVQMGIIVKILTRREASASFKAWKIKN